MNRSGCAGVHGTQLVKLSLFGFAFWWLVILVVHIATCAYNVVYAKLYWGFELTIFSVIMDINAVGVPPEDYRKIAFVYVALAALHGLCELSMVVGYLWHRELSFRPRRRKPGANSINMTRGGSSKEANHSRQQKTRVVQFLSGIYHRVASQHGVLGVKGRHFHAVLICRELVEVALQTAQAIRMSKYLPRVLLNRFYVALLVLNCWSSVFVYSRWFWRDEARRRFAAILCDCVLNLMTTMGVSLIIMLSYIDDYDINSFRFELLYDDGWVAQMLNESRVVLVVSWLDLASRAFFSIALVAATADMVGPGAGLTSTQALLGVAGTADEGTRGKVHPEHSQKNVELDVSYADTGLTSRRRKLLRYTHAAFAVWGVVMLSLHVHASLQSPLDECTPKVHPMAGSLPSCYSVEFNCHNLDMSGSREEVETEWARFDRSTAVKLRILHCRSLEVPDSFQDFVGLQEIMIYNSTITSWEATAAVTNTHHPSLTQINVLRVNMSSGVLPLGLQAHDFPALLMQITFCETNLEELPDDLNLKWRVRAAVFVENSKLTAVPLSLVRMQPYYLVLSGNPITELPPELFSSGLQTIAVGKTLVKALPRNVDPTTNMMSLDISNTNISFFPSWIDPLVEATLEMYPLLTAAGSSYCSEFEAIVSGVSSDFSTPLQPGISSLLLMNASEVNWEVILQGVDCSPPLWQTHSSLELFDEAYALKSATQQNEVASF